MTNSFSPKQEAHIEAFQQFVDQATRCTGVMDACAQRLAEGCDSGTAIQLLIEASNLLKTRRDDFLLKMIAYKESN